MTVETESETESCITMANISPTQRQLFSRIWITENNYYYLKGDH